MRSRIEDVKWNSGVNAKPWRRFPIDSKYRPTSYLESLGFGVSPPTLALVARLAAALIVDLSFLVITPGLGVGTGGFIPLTPLTIVARRRFGFGHPSGGVGGAERTSGPLRVVVRIAGGVEEVSVERFGADLELAEEDAREAPVVVGARRMNCDRRMSQFHAKFSRVRYSSTLTGKPKVSEAEWSGLIPASVANYTTSLPSGV